MNDSKPRTMLAGNERVLTEIPDPEIRDRVASIVGANFGVREKTAKVAKAILPLTTGRGSNRSRRALAHAARFVSNRQNKVGTDAVDSTNFFLSGSESKLADVKDIRLRSKIASAIHKNTQLGRSKNISTKKHVSKILLQHIDPSSVERGRIAKRLASRFIEDNYILFVPIAESEKFSITGSEVIISDIRCDNLKMRIINIIKCKLHDIEKERKLTTVLEPYVFKKTRKGFVARDVARRLLNSGRGNTSDLSARTVHPNAQSVNMTIEQLLRKDLTKSELRASIIDTCIRAGRTRQQAVAEANRHTRGIGATHWWPISKPIRELGTHSERTREYTRAQIDQLIGRWRRPIVQAKARPNQAQFRDTVLSAYNQTCAVTGATEVKTLEAAHIMPYNGPLSDVVRNGICLRADIHKLYDAGLIAFGSDYTIMIDPRVSDQRYTKFNGRKLRLPLRQSDWPRIAD